MTRPGRYPSELWERAVRLVFEHQEEHPSQWAAITSIAHKFGVSAERPFASGSVALRLMWATARTDHRGARVPQAPGARGPGAAPGQRDLEVRGFLRGGTRPPTNEMIAYIDHHKDRYGFEPICRVPPIAPSTYYHATRRPASARALRDTELKTEIARVHDRLACAAYPRSDEP